VAEPTVTGRVIAAWPSFSLIAAYELLMRLVRRAADAAPPTRRSRRSPGPVGIATAASASEPTRTRQATPQRGTVGQNVRLDAWRWAQDNRAQDGSLPSGRDIGIRYGRHERWGRLVKRAGLAGELGG
jgi:hypothetical protein